MTMLAVGAEQSVRAEPEMHLQINTPGHLPPEVAEALVSATFDLSQLGLDLANRSGKSEAERSVKRIHYGSPLEVVLVVASSTAIVAGAVLVCTKVLNGLADLRVKLATARKLDAETVDLRLSRARAMRGSNWRYRLLDDGATAKLPSLPDAAHPEDRFVAAVKVGPNVQTIELDHDELKDLYLLQAETTLRRLALDVRSDTGYHHIDGQFALSAREVKSLLILSGFDGRIELVEPA